MFEMKRNVHLGGLYDAAELSKKGKEYSKTMAELRHAILFCRQISSDLMSFHPPFFKETCPKREVLCRVQGVFLELVGKALDFAREQGIRLALESFCYPPFIFPGLGDFMEFISHFPLNRLGVLMDVGHLYQAKIDLKEAMERFKSRLCDVHIHDATQQQSSFQEATHLPLGKGEMDFGRIIDGLYQVKYDGWLTLEINGTEKGILQSKTILENLLRS
jgi:sugar phosphate isomerase/epimerase